MPVELRQTLQPDILGHVLVRNHMVMWSEPTFRKLGFDENYSGRCGRTGCSGFRSHCISISISISTKVTFQQMMFNMLLVSLIAKSE